MATFEYQALTSSGRMMTGTLEATSADQAGEMLTEMQLTVNSIDKTSSRRPRSRVGRNEFLLFNQQLASITKAGIPLERGLRELVSDIESRSVRKLVGELADDLEAGVSIEGAFDRRRRLFPPLYGRIVRAGVQTGRLSEMLTSLNRHLEVSNQTQRIFLEAISYPLVVLSLAAVLLTLIFYFIIPHFVTLFSDMGQRLPYITLAFIKAAENVIPFWIGVGVVVGGIVVLFMTLGRFPAGRLWKEAFYMKIPVIGRLFHRSLLSQLSDAMALLITAGCDMPTCLRLGADATGSETIKTQCETLASGVEQGENIVEAGALCPTIPPLFVYSVQLGSQRNELQDNLYSLSEMYAQQTRTNQARLHAILFPTMVIAVGIVVGFAVIAMFLPLVSMLNAVSG